MLPRLAGPIAVGAMLAAGMTGGPSAAPADEPAMTPAKPAVESAKPAEPASSCGNGVSILNEGKTFETFDKANGGGNRRLRFRLEGKEPCNAASDCKVVIVRTPDDKPVPDNKVATAQTSPDNAATDKSAPDKTGTTDKAAAPEKAAPSEKAKAEKVIATVSLAGRTASYCQPGLLRVVEPPRHRAGCARGWLVNFLTIKLVDGEGPFSRRDISIHYLYRPDASAVSLEGCVPPAIVDGMFRRRLWTVGLDDGAVAVITELDFPRDRRAPVPLDPPFATSVLGARE
jgi:hypothetical protein